MESKATAERVYQTPLRELLEEYRVNVKEGLSTEEARKRLERDGRNELLPKKSFLQKWFPWFFRDPLAEGFRNLMPRMVIVIRGGNEMKVDARELVEGDLVKGSSGQLIPADIRLIECNDLKADQSAFTGEPEPLKKTSGESRCDTYLDSENLLFSETYVTSGAYTGFVIATGKRTVIGTLASLVSNNKTHPGVTRADKKKAVNLMENKQVLCKSFECLNTIRFGKSNNSLALVVKAKYLFKKDGGLEAGIKDLVDRCRDSNISLIITSETDVDDLTNSGKKANIIRNDDKVVDVGVIIKAVEEKKSSEVVVNLVGVARCQGCQTLPLVTVLQQAAKTVVYIGESINDTPALAKSHCGIATEDSTDIAKGAADAVLFDGENVLAGLTALLFD
eukprot:jgi/Bigna1/75244/fgenesh1_pg.33_\